MSAWEDVPTEAELSSWSDEEREEWLRDALDELAGYAAEARFHDTDGYFAHEAGSPECLALGHKPSEFGEWDEDDQHESGWDGDLLCLGTRYGVACTNCEGECSHEIPPSVWTLPGVAAPVA